MGRLPAPTRAFAEEFGATRATTDLDELLADPRIEAVIVCSPTDLHAEQTERALRAGKHVLCEIPLATSLAATDRLIDLAERTGLRLMVCHTQRYAAPLIEARRMIASGEVRPRAMVSRYLLDKRENVSWTGRRRSWTDNLLWHHGCHAVDAALWLLGAEAIDVTARATPPDPRLGIPMDLSIVLRTTREQVVTVVMSYRALPPLQDYVVIADETTLVYANDELRDHRAGTGPGLGSGELRHGGDRPPGRRVSWPRFSLVASRSPAPVAFARRWLLYRPPKTRLSDRSLSRTASLDSSLEIRHVSDAMRLFQPGIGTCHTVANC